MPIKLLFSILAILVFLHFVFGNFFFSFQLYLRAKKSHTPFYQQKLQYKSKKNKILILFTLFMYKKKGIKRK